ncbi:MAG TPA: hypothetical protein VI488_06295 [Candidatus Angelobacter sp.]
MEADAGRLPGGCDQHMWITPNWRGGAYVAVKRKPAAGTSDVPASTAEISLLYVSRWKTQEAAQRFLDVYEKSLSKRVTLIDRQPWTPSACLSGSRCPGVKATRLNSSEGPIFLELLPNSALFIAQSFAEQTANRLRQLVLAQAPEIKP